MKTVPGYESSPVVPITSRESSPGGASKSLSSESLAKNKKSTELKII